MFFSNKFIAELVKNENGSYGLTCTGPLDGLDIEVPPNLYQKILYLSVNYPQTAFNKALENGLDDLAAKIILNNKRFFKKVFWPGIVKTAKIFRATCPETRPALKSVITTIGLTDFNKKKKLFFNRSSR